MKKKGIPYLLPLVVAVLILIVCNLFWLDHWIDSDMAAEMIFSDLLADTGHVVATPDWYYSTEFRIVYTQLIMTPLFHLTDNWHAVRVITNLCFYLFLCASYLFMIRPLQLKRKNVVLSMVLLFLPFSEPVAQHVHYGNTYISHIILMFLVVGCVFRLSDPGKRLFTGREIITTVVLILLSLICGASGVRYLMSVYAPLMLAGIWMTVRSSAFRDLSGEKEEEAPSDFSGRMRRIRQGMTCFGSRIFGVTAFSTMFALAGYLFNVTYLRTHYLFTTYENTSFIRIYNGYFYERLSNLFGCFLAIFGYISDKSVLSLRGFVSCLSFVLIGCMIFVCKRVRKIASCEKTEAERSGFFLVLFTASLAVTVFFLMFTDTTLTARYFIMPLYYLPVLTVVFLDQDRSWAVKRIFMVILMIALVISTLKIDFSLKQHDKNAAKRVVADYLVQNGYEFGFAMYDDANPLTELSDGVLSVAAVTDPESLRFFKWSSAARYYERSFHDGKVFLVLRDWELTPDQDLGYLDEAEELLRYGGLVVYSFENGDLFYDAQNVE